MLDLLLNSPIALLLVVVTLVIHVVAFFWVHAKIRKAKAESGQDSNRSDRD